MKLILDSRSIRVSALEVADIIRESKDACSSVDYIEVDHSGTGNGSTNFLQVARTSEALRRQVFALAENGYVAYGYRDRTTKFVHVNEVPRLWDPVRLGQYSCDSSGLIYTVEKDDGVQPEALVVVFSSMSYPFDKASLTRYFEQNFSSIKKHLPDGVAVLRIADIDGVVGGFYLPTVNYPHRDADIDGLIRNVIQSLGVDPSRVVLYGASKGGTAALYYGLRYGWRMVSVDPVTDDESYERRYDDTHWTSGGVFLQRKREMFLELAVSPHASQFSCRGAVVTANGSFLRPGVERVVNICESGGGQLLFLISNDSRISDHPHVSIRTLRTVTGLLNCAVQGLPFPHLRQEIFG